MKKISTKIESFLFVAARPLTLRKLAELCEADRETVNAAIDGLAKEYETNGGGLRIVRGGNDVQMATAPENAEAIREFLKDETTGELTKPSLETLTIVAYRGPITKAELEQIRGVNCSLILRNLMVRGLVESQGDAKELTATFRVTLEFLRFLGLTSVEQLPDYEKLRSHENVVAVLDMAAGKKTPPDAQGNAPQTS